MFKIFKRKRIKKAKKEKTFRDADELFSSGEIFKANKKELDNIMKELSTQPVLNEIRRHREIIRAVTVLTIKNNRYTEKIQTFNIFLSVILVFLTVLTIILMKQNIILMKKQTNYVELSTRGARIQQNTIIRNAIEYCESNPYAMESGLVFTSGKPANCDEVLNSKEYNKYKN